MKPAVEPTPITGYAPSMAPIEPQKRYCFTTSDALTAAIVKAAKKAKMKPSDFIRLAIAEKIGNPELANSVRMGRPRKE